MEKAVNHRLSAMYDIGLAIVYMFITLIAMIAMAGGISVFWQMCTTLWCQRPDLASESDHSVDPNCFELEIMTEPYLIQVCENDQDHLLSHLRDLTLQPTWQLTDDLPGLDQGAWLAYVPDRLPREQIVIHLADVISQSIALGYCSVTQWLLSQICDLTKMSPAIRLAFRSPNALWMRMIITRLRSLGLEQSPELARILSRERPTCSEISEQRLEQLDLCVGWTIGAMLRVDDFEDPHNSFLAILNRAPSLKQRYYGQAISASLQLNRADLAFALVERGGYQDLLFGHLETMMTTLLTRDSDPTSSKIPATVI